MSKLKSFIASTLLLAAPLAAHADDGKGEFGGYVSNEETRFKDYVWDFLEEFSQDCSGICTDLQDSWVNESYKQTQYFWGSCDQLLGSSLSNVDSTDIAYVAGHGSPSLISMGGTSCDLKQASWGSKSRNGVGDLEAIVLHSCQILSLDGDWRSRWKRSSATSKGPFAGLHTAMGFRTNHNHGLGAGSWASDEFAENLEDGETFKYGWYNAAESAYWLSPYAVIVEGNNKQSIFFVKQSESDTMLTLKANEKVDANFGQASYLVNAYYRN